VFALFSTISARNLSIASTSPLMTEFNQAPRLAPAIFISHGGGPCFFMEGGSFTAIDKNSDVAQFYRDFAKNFIPVKPKAIVIVSAHWEEATFHITSNPSPKLLFDYYGFPDFTYKLTYPAKCDVDLSKRIQAMLKDGNVPSNLDPNRDWDHGVFVPLKLIYPDADIPLVQISLNSNLDPALHIRLGEILAPLRKEGIMILGSGQATHNMGMLRSGINGEPPAHVVEFLSWMNETAELPTKEARKKRLLEWAKLAPHGRLHHPREEHLIPLHVVAGAAGNHGKAVYTKIIGNMGLNAYLFDD